MEKWASKSYLKIIKSIKMKKIRIDKTTFIWENGKIEF